MTSTRRNEIAKQTGLWLLLSFLVVWMFIPTVSVLVASITTRSEWLINPLTVVPDPPTLENYSTFWRLGDIPEYLVNSTIVTTLSVVGMVASCAIVAYPFARIPFRGRRVLFLVLLAAIMLPPQVLLIPQYLLFVNLGWVDTLLPLIVPNFLALGAFYVFFLRQSYRAVPKDLADSMMVDGAGHWTILWRLIVPLCKGPLIVVAIIHAVATYNDFFAPLIYLHSPSNFTMPIGVVQAASTVGFVAPVPVVMAGTVLLLIPILVTFAITQRWLASGIQLTGGVEG